MNHRAFILFASWAIHAISGLSSQFNDCKKIFKKGILLKSFVFFFLAALQLYGQPQWKKIGELKNPRHLHSALPLDTNTILVMGGFLNSYGSHSGEPTATCELIDVANRVISPDIPMNEPRAEFVALTTPDSNIIVLSGVTSGGYLTAKCEIYDRFLKQWKVIGSLIIPRRQHSAQFLNSSEILVVGGRHQDLISTGEAEIFNITTGKSRIITPYPVAFNIGFGVISSIGEFILCGGREGGSNSSRTKDVFKYDATNNKWIKTSEIPNGVGAGQGLKLWNGNAIFSGGSLTEEPHTATNDIVFENGSSYSYFSRMQHNRVWHSMAQWNNDTVAIFGGFKVGGTEGNGTMFTTNDWLGLQSKKTFKGPELTNGRAYFTAVSLPLRDSEGNILKPRILAISGLGSNNKNTPIVEILEQEFITTSKPPTLTLLKTGCTSAIITIMHSEGIEAAWLVSAMSDNVSITLAPMPPAESVTATIQLQDHLRTGKYTLYAVGSSGTTANYSGDINPTAGSEISVSPLETTGIFTIEPDYPGKVHCREISFKNTSPEAFTIDNAFFCRNVEFSLALSQLPVLLQPGESRLLKVCFEAPTDGDFRDTLSIGLGCTTLRVPFFSQGLPDSFTGEANCNISLSLTPKQKTMLLSAPYPNPAHDIITVKAEFTGTPSASCVVKDIFGNTVSSGDLLKTSGTSGIFTVSTINLAAGLYALCIAADGDCKTFPIIIE